MTGHASNEGQDFEPVQVTKCCGGCQKCALTSRMSTELVSMWIFSCSKHMWMAQLGQPQCDGASRVGVLCAGGKSRNTQVA